MKSTKTLAYKNHNLSNSKHQIDILNDSSTNNIPLFKEVLSKNNQYPLKPSNIDTLQVNLGKMCNQTCIHCHVDAGPDRKEIMTKETIDDCLNTLKSGQIKTLDLTGGAPEMNPNFRYFVEKAYSLVDTIIVRSNLTIIVANKSYFDLPDFFKKYNIEVTSSLPCYTEGNTDSQRGNGVFNASIKALNMLNNVGYGKKDSGLKLNLVYNPNGAFLPGDQSKLEQDYKKQLLENFNIHFNQLYTITNMPISRYLDYLQRNNKLDDYLNLLFNSYNNKAVDELMCKQLISVGYDGKIYDCDFNQMLDIEIEKPHHIKQLDFKTLKNREIKLNQHCFGCTAGSGSSCTGALAS